MLKTVIKKMTGAKQVDFIPLNPNAEWNQWGYIDHQSSPREQGVTGGCGEMFESEQNLRRFIFNSRSELVISNDNI